MSTALRNHAVFWVLRLLAIGVSLSLSVDLLRQFLAGSISMGHGEFNDRIVVTSPLSRTLALLMWGTFFLGLFLAGVRPQLFVRHRWLAPAFLIAVLLFFVVFSIVGDYQLQ